MEVIELAGSRQLCCFQGSDNLAGSDFRAAQAPARIDKPLE